MSGRKGIIAVGGIAAAAGGYYFYQAGGDPKVAKKEVQHDYASAKASVKGQSVSSEEAKKQGEEWAARAGSKLDSTVNDARNKIHDADKTITKNMGEAESKLDKIKHDSAAQYEKTKKETAKELNQSIDNFDKTVEKKTAEAKSGISSWFGFGK